MGLLKSLYQRLLTTCGFIAGILIGCIALFVTVDVVLRNIGMGGIPWIIEVAEYTLFISAFIASPWVLSMSGHVRVDLLVNSLPKRGARVLELAAEVVGLLVCLVLFASGSTQSMNLQNLAH
jgi:TRAP-type C4-dicarboxylate transport system permease small subunit